MALVSSTSSLGGLAGGNALARLLVVFSGDTSGLERAVAQAKGTIAGFGQNAGAIGSALTRSLTLPILAAGGASVFLASQFQSSLGRVAGLTPILSRTGDSIEEIGNQLLEMSTRVPTAPVELADALYFAGSAGLDAATAMQVVELAAGGAAIGMGEASDIAKVLIFSLNAFESQGLTAAAAMDTLTVAIREGTAEPDELAVALGRLLPVAKQAGITFAETVGAVASLTNIGFPARVATVALRALFAELLAPTQQATQRLKTLGLEAEDLRESMRLAGPIGAFKLLEDAVKGDDDALRDILPQIRGFSAYVGITGDRLEKSIKIMERATNATGAFDKALKIIAETPAFKFQIGLNKLRIAAIELGNILIPVFVRIGEVIGGVADSIAALPGPAQKALVVFLGLAAAAGPLLKLFGNMGAFSGTLISGFKQVTTTTLAMGVAAIAATAGFQSLASGSTNLFSVLTTVAASALTVFSALRLLQGALPTVAAGVHFLGGAWRNAAGQFAVAPSLMARFGTSLTSLSTGGLAAVAIGIGLVVAGFALMEGESKKIDKAAEQAGEAMLTTAKSAGTLRTALNKIEDEEVKQDLIEIARALHLLDQAAGQALPKLAVGVGDELITDLQRLNQLIHETGQRTFVPNLDQLGLFTRMAGRAAEQGVVLDRVFNRNGTSASALNDILEQLSAASPDQDIRDLAGEARRLVPEYNQAVTRVAAFNQAQLDTINMTRLNQEATAAYADELGVSTEFLQSHLDAAGVSAVAMTDEVKDAFELMAGGVDGSGRAIELRVAEMEAAIAESASRINESIEGAFAGFEKADDKVKQSTSRLLEIFRNNARAVITETANLRQLAERGVPSDVLEFLAEQGPGFVSKFVDASDRELNRLVVLYQAQLAAVDSEIVQESLHQQTKGAAMVQKFVQGILSNDSLPTTAARQIVLSTVDEFSRGDISSAGLRLALNFARGLGTVRGLSQQEGADALRAFISAVEQGNLEEIGRRQAQEIANGIAAAANIPRQKALDLVLKVTGKAEEVAIAESPLAGKLMAVEYAQGITSQEEQVRGAGRTTAGRALAGLSSKTGEATTLGSNYSAQFAAGILLQREAAYNAAAAVAQAANQGFEDNLKNSPKYFTYYAGQRLVDQLGEGMESRATPTVPTPRMPYPMGSPSQGRSTSVGAGSQDIDLDVDLRLDRGRVMREVDWDWRVSGSN